MKKIVIMLALAFLLVGCTSKNPTITNGDEVIFESIDTKYSAANLFEDLKVQDYTSVIMSDIVKKIGTLENIDITSIENETEATIKELVDGGSEYYIEYYYGTVDAYREQTILNEIITELLNNKAKESFDEYKESSKPYKAEVAFFETAEDAKKVIEQVNSGEHTFAFAASENGFTGEVTEKIYTDGSDLPLEVKDYVLNTSTGGMSDVIQSSTIATDAEGNSAITPRYYLVNVISKNADEFKDDFISYLANEILDSKVVLGELMSKHNVKVYDQRTYELLKKNYGDFK